MQTFVFETGAAGAVCVMMVRIGVKVRDGAQKGPMDTSSSNECHGGAAG